MRYAQLPKKRLSVYLVLEAVSTKLLPYDDCDENERAKGKIKLHLATFDESKAIKKGKNLINGKELTSYNEKRYCLGYYREYNPYRDIMILNLPFGEYKTDNYGFPLWEFKSGSWFMPRNTISNLPLLTKKKKINRAKEGNPVYLIVKTTETRTENDDSVNNGGDMAILFATLDYTEARSFLENEQKLNKAYMRYGEAEPYFFG